MIFYSPVFLLFLIPLLFLFFKWHFPSKRVAVLRFLLLILLLLSLAEPAVKFYRKNGKVIVVLDKSASMPSEVIKSYDNNLKIINSELPENCSLGVVSFAESAEIIKLPETNELPKGTGDFGGNQSALNEALEIASGMISDNAPGRILLISDGKYTGEHPDEIFAKLAVRGIGVDYRLRGAKSFADLAISDIIAPNIVASGEFFTVKVQIFAPQKCRVNCQIVRDKKIVLKDKLELHSGVNTFTFRDSLIDEAVALYELNISGLPNDPVKENNSAQFVVKSSGRKPVLLISQNLNSSLGKLLKKIRYSNCCKTAER